MPITTEFGFSSTAAEVAATVDLTGQRAVVTGASNGIGVETARALAMAGAEVTIAVRDVAAGQRIAEEIGRNATVAHLDLLDQASVRAFVKAWSGPLHLLVNNAGIMALPTLELTEKGWEKQFATNHLGHFTLTTGLEAALKAEGARVVCVSSTGHLRSPVVFDDINFSNRPYDPWAAYGQSKTANVLLAVEVTNRWGADGVVGNALMPGGIMTGLQKHVSQEVQDGWKKGIDDGSIRFKTTEQGASTTLVAAVHPAFADGGHYLEDCNESPTVGNDAKVGAGVREYALDPANAARLWDLSEQILA